MHMTKVISLSNRAYEVLSSLKKGKESFSDVVLKLSKREKKKSLVVYSGRWKGDDITEVFATVSKERKNSRSREVKF